MTPLLSIQDLKVDFGTGPSRMRAIDGVSLEIQPGETLCLVGESGSGKSVTARSIARLLPPTAKYVGGQILLGGRNTLEMSAVDLRRVRGGVVSYVFQEPGASLNPVMRIGRQIRESLQLHRPEAATQAEVLRLLKLVGIPAPEARIHGYSHELSGGMQQRVLLAMALASQPKLLVADEPTTALDTTVQAQILQLLRELQRELGMAILFITHNLGIVNDIADRMAVMYAGQIVEAGPARELLALPLHPYTQALKRAVPQLGRTVTRLHTIPGKVPHLGAMPSGCRFHPRCALARAECSSSAPQWQEAQPGRWVRCPSWREANEPAAPQ